MVVWLQYLHQRSGGPSPPSSHRGGQSCSPEAGTESQAAAPLLSRDALLTATHSNCQQQRREESYPAGVLEIWLFRHTALTVEVNTDQILQYNCCTQHIMCEQNPPMACKIYQCLEADLWMMPGSGVSLLTPISSLVWGWTGRPACGDMGGQTFTMWPSTEAVASTPSGPNDAKCSGGSWVQLKNIWCVKIV